MKVLMVTDYAVSSGGAEIVLSSLRDELCKRGHAVKIFSSSVRFRAGEKIFSDYTCFGTTSFFRVFIRTINPWAYIRLRKVLDRFQPDIVHVHLFLNQLSPLILPLLKKYPSIYHAHWLRAVCPMGSKMLPDGSVCHEPAGSACYKSGCLLFPAWVFIRLQTRLFLKWRYVFNRVVANSRIVAEELEKEGFHATDIVLNGVPIQSPSSPASLSISPVIVFAGRLIPEKGADILFRAFYKISEKWPDARLIMVGEGPQMPYLKMLAEQLDLRGRIFFTGYLLRFEIEKLFESAWVQVIPSRCLEAFPLAAMESIMRGTALVASDYGGIGEIIRASGAGILVPPGDRDALARAILHLLDDRQRCREMGMSGRKFALKYFSIESFVEKMISIYRSCLLGESESGKEREP